MRTIQLLHVEDDESQRRLIAHHLKQLLDCSFAITFAENETAALAAFESKSPDIVILDYQLQEGNGISCLQGIRRRNTTVPVIAISGTASPQTAAELLHNGADDFIRKQDLTSEVLGQSVRTALERADAGRRNAQRSPATPTSRAKLILCLMSESLLQRAGRDLLLHFESLEQLVGQTDLTSAQWDELLDDLHLSVAPPSNPSATARLLQSLVKGLRQQVGGAARSMCGCSSDN